MRQYQCCGADTPVVCYRRENTTWSSHQAVFSVSRCDFIYLYSQVITSIIMANQESHEGIAAPGLTEADQSINNTTEDISHKASGHKADLSSPSKS